MCSHLISYVWAEQNARFELLRGALAIAQRTPPVVDRERAWSWLMNRSDDIPRKDALTVVWHSITQVYWPADEITTRREYVGRAA